LRAVRARSVEPAAFQVDGNDDVGDGVKHKLYVVGVRGTGLVAVDLLHGRTVLGFKLLLDVRSRCLARKTS